MKLLLNGNNKHFLELYEPTVTLIDPLIVTEDENFNEFLEDYALTVEDLKKAGLGVRNGDAQKIATIKEGSKIKILDFPERGEMTIGVGSGDNYIEFDINPTYVAEKCRIEAVAKDEMRESALGRFKGLPKEDDTTIFYGYYVTEEIDAINTLHYDGSDSELAFEDLKCMTEDEILKIVNRYKAYLERFEYLKGTEGNGSPNNRDEYGVEYIEAEELRKLNIKYKKGN